MRVALIYALGFIGGFGVNMLIFTYYTVTMQSVFLVGVLNVLFGICNGFVASVQRNGHQDGGR